jgi:hypothetical protein
VIVAAMTIASLRTALDRLEEPACVEGTYRLTERLAIALPDGDVAAVDDPNFVGWLDEHAEDAPFGKRGKTKVDKGVRHARRLIARDRAAVAGFDPASILDEIEATLSPREHLEAKLTDVLIYPVNGHFARHKDTPRGADLLGTLVVGLPIAHAGGELDIVEPTGTRTIDWSGAPDPAALRWVAMFSDADHEVLDVTSGTRVTLTYALTRTGRPRHDAKRDAALAGIASAIRTLEAPPTGPLMIACTRHVITTDEVLQDPSVLRGTDADLARLLADAGYAVAVRSCIAAIDSNRQDGERPGAIDFGDYPNLARLQKAIPRKVLDDMDSTVTFGDSADYDGEEFEASNLGPYILDALPLQQWVIRRAAAATLVHEADMFSDDGYFGNEGYEAHIYTLAALEVRKAKAKAARAPAAAATKAAKPKATKKSATRPTKPKAKATKPKAKAKR